MENSLTQRLQFTMRMVYIVLILVLMEYSLTVATVEVPVSVVVS